MHDSQIDCFADNYATARAQFLQACNDSGCQVESFPHPQLGPHGEELALDAEMGARGSARQLIISSWLHGWLMGPLDVSRSLQNHRKIRGFLPWLP